MTTSLSAPLWSTSTAWWWRPLPRSQASGRPTRRPRWVRVSDAHIPNGQRTLGSLGRDTALYASYELPTCLQALVSSELRARLGLRHSFSTNPPRLACCRRPEAWGLGALPPLPAAASPPSCSRPCARHQPSGRCSWRHPAWPMRSPPTLPSASCSRWVWGQGVWKWAGGGWDVGV